MAEPNITNFKGINIEGFRRYSEREEYTDLGGYKVDTRKVYSIYTDYGTFEITDYLLENVTNSPSRNPSIFRNGRSVTIKDLDLRSITGTENNDSYYLSNTQVGDVYLNNDNGIGDKIIIGRESEVYKIHGDSNDKIMINSDTGRSALAGTNVNPSNIIDMRRETKSEISR